MATKGGVTRALNNTSLSTYSCIWTAPSFVEALSSTELLSGRLRRLPVGLLELQRGNVPAP
jgi:hypothetical protein